MYRLCHRIDIPCWPKFIYMQCNPVQYRPTLLNIKCKKITMQKLIKSKTFQFHMTRTFISTHKLGTIPHFTIYYNLVYSLLVWRIDYVLLLLYTFDKFKAYFSRIKHHATCNMCLLCCISHNIGTRHCFYIVLYE